MSTPPRIRGNKGRIGIALISLLALLLAAPILVVVTSPIHTVAPEWDHVWRNLLPAHFQGTLYLLIGVLPLSLLLAVPAAWLVAAHDFPGRRLFSWALVLPLALPTYIAAFTYADLFGPTSAAANWSARVLGLRPDMLSTEGLWLVLSLVLYPYIYLPARAIFSRGMSARVEVARTLGANGRRRFWRVALPLARPAIVGGALLVAMEALNDYGAVKFYGVRTLTTGIFRSWSGLYDLGSALRLGLVLVGLVALLQWAVSLFRRKARQENEQEPVRREPLSGARAAMATLWCGAILLFAAAIPLAKIVADVLRDQDQAVLLDTLEAFRNTAVVATLAAITTLIIALLVIYRQHYGDRTDPTIRLAKLGYVIPGAVIAMGAMALAGGLDSITGWGLSLIGSLGLLVYAFSSRFLAVAVNPLEAGLRQRSADLVSAARTLGAGPWRTFHSVDLPLLRPTLLAAAMLVAIDVIKELPLTLILRPFDFETLSTKAYAMASIEQLQDASWPALCIVLCGLLPVVLLDRALER